MPSSTTPRRYEIGTAGKNGVSRSRHRASGDTPFAAAAAFATKYPQDDVPRFIYDTEHRSWTFTGEVWPPREDADGTE